MTNDEAEQLLNDVEQFIEDNAPYTPNDVYKIVGEYPKLSKQIIGWLTNETHKKRI